MDQDNPFQNQPPNLSDDNADKTLADQILSYLHAGNANDTPAERLAANLNEETPMNQGSAYLHAGNVNDTPAERLAAYMNEDNRSNYLDQPTYPQPSSDFFPFGLQDQDQYQNQYQNPDYGQHPNQLYNQPQGQNSRPNQPINQLPDPNLATGTSAGGLPRNEIVSAPWDGMGADMRMGIGVGVSIPGGNEVGLGLGSDWDQMWMGQYQNAVPGLNTNLPQDQAAYQAALLRSIHVQQASQRPGSQPTPAPTDGPYGPAQEDAMGNPIFPTEWFHFFSSHGNGRTARYNRQLGTDVVYNLTPIQWLRQFCQNMAQATMEQRVAEWARLFGSILSPAWGNFFSRELSMITPMEWIAILVAIDNGEGPQRAVQWHNDYRDEFFRQRELAIQAQRQAQGQGQQQQQPQAQSGVAEPPAALDPSNTDDLYGASPPSNPGPSHTPIPPALRPPGQNPLDPITYVNCLTNKTSILRAHKGTQVEKLADSPEYWGRYDDDGPPKPGERTGQFRERLHRARYNMQIRRRPIAPFTFSKALTAAQKLKENDAQRKEAEGVERTHRARLSDDLPYATEWKAKQTARRVQNSLKRKAAFEHKRRTLLALGMWAPDSQSKEPDDSDHEDFYERPPPPVFGRGDLGGAAPPSSPPDDDDEDRNFEAFKCEPCTFQRRGCSFREHRYPCDRCISKRITDKCVRRQDKTDEDEIAQLKLQRPAESSRQYGPYIPSLFTVLSDAGDVPPDLAGDVPPAVPPTLGRRAQYSTARRRATAAKRDSVEPVKPPVERKRKRYNMAVNMDIDDCDDYDDGDDDIDDNFVSPPAKRPSRKRHAPSKKTADRPSCDQCMKYGRRCNGKQPCSECQSHKIQCNDTLQDQQFHNLYPSSYSHVEQQRDLERFADDEDDMSMNPVEQQHPIPPAIDPNLETLVEQFGPAQLFPQPKLPPNQVMVLDDRPTTVQANTFNQFLLGQVDPALPQMRHTRALEAELRQRHLQQYPAQMADENEAHARANWGSVPQPGPSDSNRQHEDARDGLQPPIDQDVEMEDAQTAPPELNSNPLDCCKFPLPWMAAVTAANWVIPEVPLGQEPVDMTMDPGKTCREIAGFMWWNDRLDLPGPGTRISERARLKTMCGSSELSHPTQKFNWKLMPRDPAKDCDHLLDDDICSRIACHVDQVGRMRLFHREEELVNHTKRWFCVACKARLDEMRRKEAGVRHLLIGQCSCIGQLRNTWLCNVHRFETKQIIEARLRPRLATMFNHPTGWHDCPTGWCSGIGGEPDQGENDSGAWQCRNCCSVVSLP